MKNQYEFDEPTLLAPFAIGVPGQRTFFLIVGQQKEWVRVWLEKEYLQALAEAIDQLLFALSQAHAVSSSELNVILRSYDIPKDFPSAEFEIEQISLSYDEGRATLSFSAHMVGPQKQEDILLECRVALAQLKQFGDEAKKVCAAGRPRCSLCGGPIDPSGHICPMIN